MSVFSQVPKGTLILIGARQGDLERHPLAARTILVQPEAGMARVLSREAATWPGASLHPVALGCESAAKSLRVMNMGEMNSLRPGTSALLALLPGLREVSRQEVRMITLADLLDQVGDLPNPVRMSLVAPGDEADILEGLVTTGLLDRLTELTLRCGEVVLHEGGKPRVALEARLIEAGFVLCETDDSDPDWPVLTFRADPNGRALKQARERIAALEAAAGKAQAEAGAQESALTEAQAQLAEAKQEAAALKTQLKELGNKADWRQTRIAELEAEATKARQEAEIQLKALRDQARGHQSRIGELGAEAQEAQAAAEAQAKAQEARIAELEVEAVKARQEIAALKSQLKEISEKADWRHARIGELEAAAGKTKEEANLLRKDVQERQKRQADLEHRLQLAHNDLRRAEGQIDLIKDLLLRGETL